MSSIRKAHTHRKRHRETDTDRQTARLASRDRGSRCRRQEETQRVTDIDRHKRYSKRAREEGVEEDGKLPGL